MRVYIDILFGIILATLWSERTSRVSPVIFFGLFIAGVAIQRNFCDTVALGWVKMVKLVFAANQWCRMVTCKERSWHVYYPHKIKGQLVCLTNKISYSNPQIKSRWCFTFWLSESTVYGQLSHTFAFLMTNPPSLWSRTVQQKGNSASSVFPRHYSLSNLIWCSESIGLLDR